MLFVFIAHQRAFLKIVPTFFDSHCKKVEQIIGTPNHHKIVYAIALSNISNKPSKMLCGQPRNT